MMFHSRNGASSKLPVDESKIDDWIFPTNVPVRKYQKDICETSLFNNTLVCLPTGLGKTMIAAVVMFNYYRWYPDGKVVFLAPTKPLVTQQVIFTQFNNRNKLYSININLIPDESLLFGCRNT